MIQIYSPDNENFEYNGDMILMPSSCEIVVELNGSWELQLDHPLDNEGRYKYIQENAVVKAPSFNGEQKFRIYKIEPTISGIAAYARPIFMDAANDCFLMDVRPTAKNGQAALDIMCAVNTKYKGQSNITTVNTAYYIRQNLIQAINGDIDQSFINRWGGEILFDNYTIIINQRAGGNYGAEVRYRKNISDVNSSVDMSNVITRIVPVAYNGHMIDSTTPWVDSENIDKYPIIYIREIQYDDVKMREDAQEDDEENGVIICDTQQELTTALIQKATETFDNEGVDLPSISIDVDMVLLQDTEEYKDFKALETVSLGDDVKCIYEPLGIDVTSRVVTLTYDCLLKRVTNVTLGEFQDNYFDDMSSIYNRVESSIRQDGTLVAEKINGILNGIYTQLKIQSTVAQKVEGRAFVVEDTDPESPLYGCMVWGTQGLEISTTRTADGRDWDFSTAITAQGIVADAIITGILSDKTGQNYWNLDTGEFRLTSSNFMVDDETVQDYIDGTIDDKVAKMRTLTLTLTNEFQGVATQSDGSGGDYSYCYTNALLFIGTTDITESSAVRWTTNASAGVSGQWDSTQKRYSVTNMTIDDGYVDITATYSNLTTTKRFSVARVRAGQNGRVYFVIPSVNIIKQGANNFYSPTNVTFNSYYRDGTAAENIAYSGRMKVEISNDGSVWTEHGILNQDSSSIMVAMPMASENPNVKMLRCTLYAAGGFTDALDQQTIAVVRDIDNLTQEEVFNILTNNGQVQGIYMQDGRLYLNGQYMQIGKISSKDGLTYWDLDNSEFVTNGEINQYWDNGNLGLRIRGSLIEFFSPSDSNNLIGALYAGASGTVGDGQRIFLGHRENDELHFARGVPGDDGLYTSQAYFDDSELNMFCPLSILGNSVKFYAGDNDFVGQIFGSSNLRLYIGHDQGNELHFGVRNSDGNYTSQIGINNEATQFYSYVRNRYGNQFGIFIGSDMSYNGISAIFSMTLSSNTSGYYIHCNTNAGAYGITIWASDGRLKKNIKETDVNAIDIIKQIKHRQFDWKENNQHEKIGYIAQELEEINEDLVRKVPQYDEDNKTVLDYRYQVDDERLIPYMTKAIQELTERVEHLESIIAGINKVSAMNEIKEVIKQYDDEEIKFYKPTVQEPPKTEENKVNEV